MTVTTTASLEFHEFRRMSQELTGADGFFRALASAAGDASSGQHELVLQEPDDKSLPYRALLPLTLVIQQTGDGTGGQSGWLRVYGKAAEDYEQTVQSLVSYAQVGAEGFNYFVIRDGGQDAGGNMRDRGWLLPAAGSGSPRQFTVVVELVNRGATVTSSAYIFGWYKHILPGGI